MGRVGVPGEAHVEVAVGEPVRMLARRLEGKELPGVAYLSEK